MKELYTARDIFTIGSSNDAVCILTNGVVRNNGEAVMGAGQAKQAKDKWPMLPSILGKYIREYGNRPFILGNVGYTLLSFPTKWDYKDNSDITLIVKSAELLVEMADKWNFKNIYMPPPGSGLGGLSYDNIVKPWLEMIFDDRFVIVIR